MSAPKQESEIATVGKMVLVGGALYLLYRRLTDKPVRPPSAGSAHPGTGTGEPSVGPAVQVDSLLTPMPPSTAYDLMYQGVVEELQLPDKEVNRHVASMLTAHSALETGNFQQMYHFNWGNITTGGGQTWFYQPPSDTVHKYIAYRDVTTGLHGFIRLILRKYPKALQAAKDGEPIRYAHELKMGGYYEANEERYAKALSALYGQYDVKYGWRYGGTDR